MTIRLVKLIGSARRHHVPFVEFIACQTKPAVDERVARYTDTRCWLAY